MIFVLVNCLFNGLVLMLMYTFAYAIWHMGDSPHTHHLAQWVFGVLGLGTAGVLTYIGTSKFGCILLRPFLGVRHAVKRERQILEPLLEDVIAKCNQLKGTNFNLDKLHLMVSDSKQLNAQAFGKDTIIITDGLIRNSNNEELLATLAHELGHLYYKDSIILVAILFGNFATRLIMWLYGIYAAIRTTITIATSDSEAGILSLLTWIPTILFLPVILLYWIGTRILNLTLLFMGRKYEYRADQFAKELGYAEGLISVLEKEQASTEYNNTMLGKVFATHPAPMKRIDRLER